MSATMEKVEGYLKQMGLTYRVVSEENRILLPYRIRDRRFYVVIGFGDKWVRFHTLIASQDKMGKVNLGALAKELLVANGNLAEVKYFMTEKGDVGVVGHEGVDVLTMEGFKQEYNAIPYGIGHFIDNIASKLKINVPGFE